jgi:hypothetical protein
MSDTTMVATQQLVQANDVLARLLQLELPGKTNYWLSRIARFVNDEAVFFNEFRNRLIRRFGSVDPAAPTRLRVAENTPQWAAFIAEVQPVAEEMMKFPFHKMDIDAFQGHITAQEIMVLDFMLKPMAEPEEAAAEAEVTTARAARHAAVLAATPDVPAPAPILTPGAPLLVVPADPA